VRPAHSEPRDIYDELEGSYRREPSPRRPGPIKVNRGGQ